MNNIEQSMAKGDINCPVPNGAYQALHQQTLADFTLSSLPSLPVRLQSRDILLSVQTLTGSGSSWPYQLFLPPGLLHHYSLLCRLQVVEKNSTRQIYLDLNANPGLAAIVDPNALGRKTGSLRSP